MHRICSAYFTETVHNRNCMRIRRVHNSVWLRRLLCLILVFVLSAANIAPWASSDTDIDCEVAMDLFQIPCFVVCDDCTRTDVSHSDTTILEFFKSCHSECQDLSPVPVSEFMAESGPDVCQCCCSTGEQNRPFKAGLSLLSRYSIRLTTLFPLQIPYSDIAFSWDQPEQIAPFLPPAYLKSLSTIVLIV